MAVDVVAADDVVAMDCGGRGCVDDDALEFIFQFNYHGTSRKRLKKDC